jgi:tellurite resistance protein TerC
LVFGCVIVVALVLDLGFLSKKNAVISIGQALRQTFFWVLLAFVFFIFMWVEEGQKLALEYLSGYLMEWSLSIDNIFVFILIFLRLMLLALREITSLREAYRSFSIL